MAVYVHLGLKGLTVMAAGNAKSQLLIWKMGQVTPLFKRDDEFNKANYRPITVLTVLSNI